MATLESNMQEWAVRAVVTVGVLVGFQAVARPAGAQSRRPAWRSIGVDLVGPVATPADAIQAALRHTRLVNAAALRRAMTVRAPASQEGGRTYFSHGWSFGSDAILSPLTVVLNKGMSPLQFSNRSRGLADYRYGAGLGNVWYTLTHPKETIETTGVRRFITTEVFPLNFHFTSGKWFPNYFEHLVGGGASYTALREWFDRRGVRHTWIWAGSITMASALLNESMENNGRFRTSADHLADLMLFDLASVLVFNVDWVNRVFSHTFQVADWSPQASFTPTGKVHNNGQYMSWHVDLPVFDRASVFWRLGLGGLLGGAYRFGDTDRISIGVGLETSQQLVQDAATREFTISTEGAMGFFYDRNNSLLASLVLSQLEKDFLSLNVYPGVVPWASGSLGFWTVLDQDFNPTLGVTLRQAMGAGVGLGLR